MDRRTELAESIQQHMVISSALFRESPRLPKVVDSAPILYFSLSPGSRRGEEFFLDVVVLLGAFAWSLAVLRWNDS
jgi:hypothetical protein